MHKIFSVNAIVHLRLLPTKYMRSGIRQIGVFMCVCVCVCLHACVHPHVLTCVCAPTCAYVRVHMCMRVCASV